MTLEPKTITQVLNDQCASYWLKSAIRQLLDRDPIDSLTDAETLYNLMVSHIGQVFRQKAGN